MRGSSLVPVREGKKEMVCYEFYLFFFFSKGKKHPVVARAAAALVVVGSALRENSQGSGDGEGTNSFDRTP